MKYGLLASLLILLAGPAVAGEVQIVHARFEHQPGGWMVNTTLRHDDTGWDHYADAWRVVNEKGEVLGTRTLYHPHQDEQPFTRSQRINIPAGTRIVFVEAHSKEDGWSKQRLRVDLAKASGAGYEVR